MVELKTNKGYAYSSMMNINYNLFKTKIVFVMVEDLTPKYRLWLESEGEPIVGKGRIELLETVRDEGSLNKAAKKMGMSYRHLWGTIKKIEDRLDFKLVETVKGGKKGGGTSLTEKAEEIIYYYKCINDALIKEVKEKESCENMATKLSARNQLKGKIIEVEKGPVGAKIKIKIEPETMTAFITKEAAEDLDLKEGDEANAVIKATEVMISKS